MVSSGNRVSGVVVRGIDPDRVNGVIDIERYIKEGSLKGLKTLHRVPVDKGTAELPGVILGARLAGQIGVMVGDPVQLISPLGTPTPMGLIPRIKRFVVTGLFDSGMHEYDSSLLYMNLGDAQRFFELGDAVTSIDIRVQDVYQAQEIARRIQQRLGFPYLTEDWSRLWPNLFSALRLEKTVYFLVLLLMVLIGAFNIISTLIMVVMEKRRDIAILQSMGAKRQSIRRIFLIKGTIIGTVGTFLGVLFGYVICLLIQRYQFIELPKDVFLISTVPVRIYLGNFALVSVASLLVCLLASIYPARQAAKLDPVEIIRYE
jgi:lipoprotein-releasing system permease protein